MTIDEEIDLILESQSSRSAFSKIRFILFEGQSLGQDAIDVASITFKQLPKETSLVLKTKSKEVVIQCPLNIVHMSIQIKKLDKLVRGR